MSYPVHPACPRGTERRGDKPGRGNRLLTRFAGINNYLALAAGFEASVDRTSSSTASSPFRTAAPQRPCPFRSNSLSSISSALEGSAFRKALSGYSTP